MAERGRPGPRPKDRTGVLTLVRDHRANDAILGHVGRLTYISPRDGSPSHQDGNHAGSIGTILTSRATGQAHTWREVKPFQKWDSPLATDAPESSAESSVPPRIYMKWLLQGAPEVLEGIAGPPSNRIIEDVRESELVKPPRARLPLLAHGEISNICSGERKACHVLAMAAGESGHALRIVRVTPQYWAWTVSGNASLELDTLATRDQGYWCGNALAINQIKFVADNPAKPLSRWLLAQTAAETLIFEPTLGRVPVLDTNHACLNSGHQAPSYISMGLKIRIPTSETGGRMHCDMAFNPATSKLPPQLAIVDDGGNWTVWNIYGDRHVRRTVLSAVLHARGNLADGVDPSSYSATAHGLGYLNRVVWLPCRPRDAGDGQGDEQSRTLLLGNATSIRIVNIDHPEKPVLKLDTVHSGSLDVVLDIQVSPSNAAHVFVLTTVAVFWFDLSKVSDHFNPKPAPGAPRAKQAQPLLLLSCPHLRNSLDRTMKLCLSAAKSQHAQAGAVAAFVYSLKSPEAMVFRFSDVQAGLGATYEQQLVRFSSHLGDEPLPAAHGTRKTRTHRYRGLQAIVVNPAQLRMRGLSKLSHENFGQAYVEDGVEFFQIISLQPDLSLQWALYSCSPPGVPAAVAAPFPKTSTQKSKESKATSGQPHGKRSTSVDYFAGRFVVPDDFEDAMASEETDLREAGEGLPPPLPVPVPYYKSKAAPAASDTEASETQAARKNTLEVYNMSRLFSLLDARLEEAAVEAFEGTDAPRGSEAPSPLDMIRQIIDIAAEHGSFAYTTLLSISNADYLREFGADLTDLSWTRNLAELGVIEERRVTVFDQLRGEKMGRQEGNKGLSTLYEVLGKLCAVSLARDGTERYSDDPFVRRQGLLAYMAVRLFFSQISMVVMPPQVAYNASARTTPAFEDAQSTLSTPYAAPAPAPDARAFRDSILSSSPTKPSVPSWLLSSSQEYGAQGDDSPSHGDEYVLPSMEIDLGGNGVDGATTTNVEDEEDAVIGRLRQFAKTIKSEPPRADGELRLLTHWELGSDPAEFHWVPLGAAGEAEEEMRRQAQEAREKKQRKLEKRAMRDRERLLSMGVGMGGSGSGSGFGGHLPSSQPMSSQLPIQLPSQFHSQTQGQTQGSAAIMSSQVFSSQVMPSSQPVIHSGVAFSQRPKKKKKKPTTARGFK